ncbi:MAG: hypothetical protein JOZ96_03645 [Acidobacteria bacterium]|nr:hypothetical protein [Acidobacteriota bacterium]
MPVSARTLLACALLGAVALSPVASGALAVFPYAALGACVAAFAAYAFGRTRGRAAKGVSVVLLSACFGVTLFDLAARPLLLYLSGARPSERYIQRWPPLPSLQRYAAGVEFDGETYGDLSATSGRAAWRELHRVRFVTDGHGFRNEPRPANDAAPPFDVIVLGDSFGVAASTTQDETLSAVLARDYRLNVYNLSISREGPRHEYANLLLEGPRLKTREGACVLWLIFDGNDLDDAYPAELMNPRPARLSLFERLTIAVQDFRASSPVRRIFVRGDAARVLERSLPDGRRVLFHKDYAERRGRTAEAVARHQNFAPLRETFEAMRGLAAERRLKVLVALVPSKEEVYSWVLEGVPAWPPDPGPSGFAGALGGLCEREGFGFLDLKPVLSEEARREYERSGALLWWPDDTHWNALGQRAAARAVYQNLPAPPARD